MKIKSVTIEGMHNVAEKKYTFDNLSYLYGKNGAGKSTALQAIQLALLGYIPGVDKKNEAILRHAKGKMLSVTCVLNHDGQDITVTRSWIGSGKGITKAVDISPEGFDLSDVLGDIELPIHNFTEFMNMTANKMKDWFINFLPNEDAQVNWHKELTESLGDMKVIDEELIPTTLAELGGLPGNGVDYIRAVNSYFKDQTSFLKGNLQRTQGTIQSLVFYDDCDSTLNSADIQNQIKDIQEKLMKAAKISQIKQTNERIQAQLACYDSLRDLLTQDERYNELRERNTELVEMIKKFDSDVVEINTKIVDLKVDLKSKQAITSGGGICPYTKTSCQSIVDLTEQLNKEISMMLGEIAKLENSLSNTNLALQSAKNTFAANQKEIASIEGNYVTRDQLRAQLQQEELIDGEEADIVELQNRLNDLQSQVTKVAANEQYNQLIDKLTAEKYKIENTLEILKVWTKLTDANGLQSTAMIKPFENLAASMDKYLHKMFNRTDISAKFNLSEKANSFSFGLVRDDKYIEFDMLSSGEQCMYTLALMMCIVASAKSPLKVILIDDLLDHLDDTNATKLFESLYKIKDIQIILAGVKECKSKCKDAVIIEVK